MRKVAIILFVLSVVTIKVAVAQAAEDKARFAAEQWIVLVDDGQYDESWKEASKIFQSSNPENDWQKKAESERNQLGQRQSRKLKDIKTTSTVKGLPAGQYILVKYQSSYANKKGLTETIAAVQEADGNWRVASYTMN